MALALLGGLSLAPALAPAQVATRVLGSTSALPPLPQSTSYPSAPPVAAGLPAWLGIHMEGSKGAPGVTVMHVVRGSPAAKSGVHDGDLVVKVDGAAVSAPSEISRAVAAAGTGKTLRLDLVRAGAPVALSVVLQARPDPAALFYDANVGSPLAPLPTLTVATGSGPAQYPALQGHVVLVDLFATWCRPCAQLGPYYAAFHGKYASQGLVVLGVSTEDPAVLLGWSHQNSVPYTVASDPTESILERLEAPALPSSLLIDKHGVVREAWVGFEVHQIGDVERKIQALLAEP